MSDQFELDFDAEVKEADDIEIVEYNFSPTTLDNGVIDYSAVENDKVFLVNKKDILTLPKPDWIPEFDIVFLTKNSFLPPAIKSSDGFYYVISDKNQIYKMSANVLAATIDYNIKKSKIIYKVNNIQGTVSLPRKLKSMSETRYKQMVELLKFVPEYKDDKSLFVEYSKRNKSKEYLKQNNIIFNQYGDLLGVIKGKILDLNIEKLEYINSYSKGEITSYGDTGLTNALYNKYGVKIKKQNGSTFTSMQKERIEIALDNVFDYFGDLSNLAKDFGLKISYADNCRQHASKACGVFSSYHNCIGVSFFDGDDDEKITMAHEISHWLDKTKGKEYSYKHASDKEGTLENQIAEKYKKLIREQIENNNSKIGNSKKKGGNYWYRTCECFARAIEQDFELTTVGKNERCHPPAYLPEEIFNKEIKPLIEELKKENEIKLNISKQTLIKEDNIKNDILEKNINELDYNDVYIKQAKEYIEKYAKEEIASNNIKNVKIIDNGVRSGFFTFVFESENNKYQMVYDYGSGGENSGVQIKKIENDGQIEIALKESMTIDKNKGDINNMENQQEIFLNKYLELHYPEFKNQLTDEDIHNMEYFSELSIDSIEEIRFTNDYILCNGKEISFNEFLNKAISGIRKNINSNLDLGIKDKEILKEQASVNRIEKVFNEMLISNVTGLTAKEIENTESILDIKVTEIFETVSKEFNEKNKDFFASYEEIKFKQLENMSKFISDAHVRMTFANSHSNMLKIRVEELKEMVKRCPSLEIALAVGRRYFNYLGNPEENLSNLNLYTQTNIGHYENGKMVYPTPEELKSFISKLYENSKTQETYIWIHNEDGSSCLKAPNGKKYFEYDPDANEVKITEASNWIRRDLLNLGDKTFTQYAEDYILENNPATYILFETNKKNIEKKQNVNESKQYSFFVKDTAEFEMYEEFETITGLTAKEAISEYKKLREDGLAAGIGINIPSDTTFNDPKGLGTTILVRENGIDTFDIYGDSFIVDLKENNERSQNRIAAYNELYEEAKTQGLNVKEPTFLFEKERELGLLNEMKNEEKQKLYIITENQSLIEKQDYFLVTEESVAKEYTQKFTDELDSVWKKWQEENTLYYGDDSESAPVPTGTNEPEKPLLTTYKIEEVDFDDERVKKLIESNNYREKDKELLTKLGLFETQQKEFSEVVTFDSFDNIPQYAVYYMTYGEDDSLSEDDKKLIDDFMKKNNLSTLVDTEDSPSFTISPAFGLPCDCVKATFSLIDPQLKVQEKINSLKLEIPRVLNYFSSSYDFLYDAIGLKTGTINKNNEVFDVENVLNFESELVTLFDENMKQNEMFKLFVQNTAKERNDIFSSDRECAALLMAIKEIGIEKDLGIEIPELKQNELATLIFKFEDKVKEIFNPIDIELREPENKEESLKNFKTQTIFDVFKNNKKYGSVFIPDYNKQCIRFVDNNSNGFDIYDTKFGDIFVKPEKLNSIKEYLLRETGTGVYQDFIIELEDNWKLDEKLLLQIKEADKSKRPSSSIWGSTQHCQKIIPGVYVVDTAGHGGMMIHKSVADLILSEEAKKVGDLENGYYQFEEDCNLSVSTLELYRNHICEKLPWIEDNQRAYTLFQESAWEYNPEYAKYFYDTYKNVLEQNKNLTQQTKTTYIPKPVTLEEILDVMEMRVDISNSGKIKVYDLQRKDYIDNGEDFEGNGNKAYEFDSASEIFERLDTYINDYFINDMIKQLDNISAGLVSAESLEEICRVYQNELEKGNTTLSEGELNLAYGIVDPDTVIMPELVKLKLDINNFSDEEEYEKVINNKYIMSEEEFNTVEKILTDSHMDSAFDVIQLDGTDLFEDFDEKTYVSLETGLTWMYEGLVSPTKDELTIGELYILKDLFTKKSLVQGIDYITKIIGEKVQNLFSNVNVIANERKGPIRTRGFNFEVPVSEEEAKYFNINESFILSCECIGPNTKIHLPHELVVKYNLDEHKLKTFYNEINMQARTFDLSLYDRNREVPKESIDTEVKPTFYLHNITKDKIVHDITKEELNELKEHLSQNGYSVNWNENSEKSISGISFSANYDEYPYIQTILEDRAINYEYKLGLLSTGYDASWLDFEEQLDAEIVTEEEFKRINELREKEFTDLHLPYVKIYFTESDTVNHKPAKIKKGTVLGFTEGIELIDDLNKKFNTFLKSDIIFYMWDEKQNDYVKYNSGFEFHDNIRTLDNGKEIPYTQTPITEEIRMICSYPEVLDLFEETWIKQFAPTVTDEQKNFIKELTDASYTKLNEHYNQGKETLSSIYDEDKKVHSSFIIIAEVADAIEQSLENQQLAIARLFNKTLERFATEIAFYLDENKELSNQEEFLVYAKHKIFNVLQDIQFQESRNVKYGENGYNFDFALWRITNEKILDAGNYSLEFDRILSIKENSLQQTEEYAKEIKENIMPEKEKKLFRYYTKRPVDFGTTPKDFVSFENFDYFKYNEEVGRDVLGFVEYNRELSEKEISDFELFKPNPYKEIKIEPTPENKLKDTYVIYGRVGSIKGTTISNHDTPVQNAHLIHDFKLFDSFESVRAFVENGFKKPLQQEKTLSESGIFVQQNSSAGMLSKYIGSDEYTVIDKFRNYAAERIEGSPEDKTYFSQMWKLGLSFCKENNIPLPTIPDEVKEEIGSNVIESLFGKITIIDNPPENNINEIPEMPLVNLEKASNEKRKEELPFTIIYNKEKGRVNIKFEQSIPTSKFNNIIKELKEAGWGYSKFNKQWYPFGNSVNNSEKFAKSLQEKYSKSEEEIIKISFPEVSFDEFTTTIENKKTDNNSIYEGIKFFDRNYQEIDEFVAYFNKNLDMFNSDVVPIDEKDARIIFEALNIERYGLPDSRQVRLGLDKENDNLILLNRKKQEIETKKLKLPDLLKLALDTIQQDNKDADKIVKNLENNNIKILGTLFDSMQENIQNVYTQMTKICDTYLSKPLQEKTINNKKSKILPLEIGDKLGDETVTDVYPIAKGINQATLSQKISIGGFTARDCMVIDNSILEKINPEISKFLYNCGERSIINTSDRVLPHLMKELIDKNYCPARDDSYYEKLENYIEENPLKYEQFYPITRESFKSSLKELVALNGGSSPDILWESKKLLNLASSTEKKKISNWLLELGCSDDKSMENLFNKWIEEKSIDKDISKKNGYPPRGEK